MGRVAIDCTQITINQKVGVVVFLHNCIKVRFFFEYETSVSLLYFV